MPKGTKMRWRPSPSRLACQANALRSDRADSRDVSGRQPPYTRRADRMACQRVIRNEQVLRLLPHIAAVARDETRSCRYSVSSCSVQATSKEACTRRLRYLLYIRYRKPRLPGTIGPCDVVRREATGPVKCASACTTWSISRLLVDQ